ncbi:MAG TPA: hypothetical protein VFS39_19160 [Nitrospira sp.]|nr:hypothetical protein [Nitrospira sp.]
MTSLQSGVMVIGMVLLGTGCAPTQLGDNYSAAYYTMIEAQVLDPSAGRTQDPVHGMEGKAAMNSVEQYRKTFEQRNANFDKSMVSSGVRTN